MPRPPKHVPPDTLGGRIRAARENLRLSLASVAGDRYSTSLISQIERNRVEPSEESLEFLAVQLRLPIEDLKLLAQRQREAEVQEHQDHVYESLYKEASQLLSAKNTSDALQLLKDLDFPRIPPALCWRLAALRGQCYFSTRQFLAAQQDFLYAITARPLFVPADQQIEAIALYMHLAATLRELEQPDAAFAQYQAALKLMDSDTSLSYVAETHWGMSLIAFQRARKAECFDEKEQQFQLALEHAENARILYRSIDEAVKEALLTCHIGLIHQSQGNLEAARQVLCKLLEKWQPELDQEMRDSDGNSRRLAELANLVSAIACSLAGIELEAGNRDAALHFVEQAKEASKYSNKLRKAEAAMMRGRILEAQKPMSDEAEKEFIHAVNVLTRTERLAARIRAHNLLGRHLLKKGNIEAGEQELDRALRLSNLTSVFSSSITGNDANHDDSSN